jgi:muramoyltetrapeptide carboxypeptidase
MYIPPKRVRAGSNVAVVAPSATFMSNELLAGLDAIRECGLNPILGPCVKNLRTTIHNSASVQERAEELNWAFSDPNISAVIAARGGEGAAALLPYLNFDTIRKSQKPFLGKSDNTSISMGILTKARLVTINGRGAAVRCDKGNTAVECDTTSLKLALELLMSEQHWGDKPFCINEMQPRTVSPGIAKGCAIGGNFNTFVHLIGTDYFPDVENTILFLEDTKTSSMELSRMLLHLKLAGVLNKLAGIVLGEFFDLPKKEGYGNDAATLEEVILQYLKDGPPCIYGVSFSHGKYTCPIPMGAPCILDANRATINFDFKMTPAVRYGRSL